MASTYPTRAYVNAGYEEDFKKACNNIQDAVKQGLPKTQKPFNKVSVLLFHWSDVDIAAVVPLENELANVFKTLYRYKVERYVIEPSPPVGTPETQFLGKIIQFAGNEAGPNNLLIYVYSGHAWAGERARECRLYDKTPQQVDPHGEPDWSRTPEIDWNPVRSVSEQYQGNVLYIFDTCFAATGALRLGDAEYLAGASMESFATVDSQRCLTNRLIQLLRNNAKDPMTVAQYASALVSQMDDPGSELDYTPVYVPARTRPSSVLAPMIPYSSTVEYKLGPPVQSPWAVLVTYRLAGAATIPNVDQFKKYLLSQVHPNIADIQVDSTYKATSYVIMIRMPYEVWACLGENPNICFVAYVKGGNILAEAGGFGQAVLTERPRGPENIPGSSRSGGDPK